MPTHRHSRRSRPPLAALLAGPALAALTLGSVVLAPSAGATTPGGAGGWPGTSPVTYAAGPASVDSVQGGPWTTSQGDPTAGSAYPLSDLLPTYTPGGSTTTIGGVTEPNLAVYPASSGTVPYASGVTGSPGPLDGYCTSGGASPETGSVAEQAAGTTDPMSPYYFPDVVRNPDGSLTGYFDYRPKDADEAITVARSTDNGKSWTTEGEALEQNPGYCPIGDVSDAGEGHPYVAAIGGSTKLYTLQRQAGDNVGVGLLVHDVDPLSKDPLASVPASEETGVDPNTFATATAAVSTTGGAAATIPVSTLGTSGSPEQIVAGPYEDADAASPSSSIITCTGTGTSSLTGCTVAGSAPLTVKAGDDLVQVIATANPGAGKTYTIPYDDAPAPNGQNPSGTGGLATLKFLDGNPTVSPLTTYTMNVNAPNRISIDGVAVYCVQSNANPTTKLENCTTPQPSGLTVNQGDAITSDPIIPATAQMTTGLVAPDGIVGTVPSYPGAPAHSTVVLYTEKILDYYIEGTINGYVANGTYEGANVTLGSTSTINYQPTVTGQSVPLTGTFTLSLGTTASAPIQTVTCTGEAPATEAGAPAGSEDLTGCTGGTGVVSVGNWVGAPDACTTPYSVLSQIGEGSDGASKGPEKLFGNNEDLTVLRAAYTYDGIHFTDLGAISGTASQAAPGGSYSDVNDPDQTTSPSATAPTNLPAGTGDATELRFVGSRGTVIENGDGSETMFLSGSWCTDGDSDAFNQIFETTSRDGAHWSTPTVVTSTDYTFSASATQDAQLAAGQDEPLGVSAYYSGRAYSPAVVQNGNGTLTMVFSGYRLPKPITAAGTVLGTDASTPYTVGATDPALYRNILTETLAPTAGGHLPPTHPGGGHLPPTHSGSPGRHPRGR